MIDNPQSEWEDGVLNGGENLLSRIRSPQAMTRRVRKNSGNNQTIKEPDAIYHRDDEVGVDHPLWLTLNIQYDNRSSDTSLQEGITTHNKHGSYRICSFLEDAVQDTEIHTLITTYRT